MNAISKPRPSPSEAFQARPVLNDPETIAAYFKQVSSYEGDRLKWAYRIAGLGWTVAASAGIIAGCAVFGTYTIAIQPPPDPIIYEVDKSTGLTNRIYNVRPGDMAASEAEDRYWLWNYVRLREGYTPVEAQFNFDTVNLLSTVEVQRQYTEWFKVSNPQSPQVILGRTGQARLRWISTTFLPTPKLAQVRYEVAETKGDTVLPRKSMVATIGFDFAHGRVSASTLNSNPRGFLVTSYHVDQENAQ